jgi:hypothetical protein
VSRPLWIGAPRGLSISSAQWRSARAAAATVQLDQLREWEAPKLSTVTSFNHPHAESHTPRGRERFDLQERVQASFRMESLRGSISHARSPSRDNLIGLVGCQTFKHARAVIHPLTGGISS